MKMKIDVKFNIEIRMDINMKIAYVHNILKSTRMISSSNYV